jgi:hypothetical protein
MQLAQFGIVLLLKWKNEKVGFARQRRTFPVGREKEEGPRSLSFGEGDGG